MRASRMVEAAGVEPVAAHFTTGDGARLPKIGLGPPRNLLPSPSPGVPCSPLESPPVVETFGRRSATMAPIGRWPRQFLPTFTRLLSSSKKFNRMVMLSVGFRPGSPVTSGFSTTAKRFPSGARSYG